MVMLGSAKFGHDNSHEMTRFRCSSRLDSVDLADFFIP